MGLSAIIMMGLGCFIVFGMLIFSVVIALLKDKKK